VNRRRAIQVVVAAPWVPWSLGTSAQAAEYASAAEVMDAVDRLEAEVGLRWRALGEGSPGARALATSALADHEGQRRARAKLRHRLRLPPSQTAEVEAQDLESLEALRSAQQELVHAHAEGLVALGDPHVVHVMAGHMVELSRHLAVIDLWIEAEATRG
jgi:hypothetical protein